MRLPYLRGEMRASVGTHFAIAITGVLAIVTALLVASLATVERQRALAAKTEAGAMVTELFAASVAQALLADDVPGVAARLGNLRSTDSVVGAAIWSGGGDPVAALGEPVERLGKDEARDEVRSTTNRLTVSRVVRDRDERVVGVARVAFSLDRENAALAATRRSLALGGAVVMLVTAGLLISLTRRRVVSRLMRLAKIAQRIEGGDLEARASEAGVDEIGSLARAMNSMGDAIAERERLLRSELQVAADLQLSVLPRTRGIDLEVSAAMLPAAEACGDYYDLIEHPHGCWIGIGDVSGHGLGAGVVMLMIQAAIAALVRANPDASPVDVECTVNRVVYENVRTRMNKRDHATLSILRYDDDGTVRYAGAHEVMLVYRAGTREVERVETPGTWVGAMSDVARATVESTFSLGLGDVVVLYTDGVTEARKGGDMFGLERLEGIVRETGALSVEAIQSAITNAVRAWGGAPKDDVSVVVFRHRGVRRKPWQTVTA